MLLYWFLPMILFLGIITSYEDIRFGKIRNVWIMSAMAYAFIAYTVILSLGEPLQLLLVVAINGFLSLLLGIVLWHTHLWSAGDAKLFFAFALLLPPFQEQEYFLFMEVLIYTFVPLSLFFIVRHLIRWKEKDLRHSLGNPSSLKEFGKIAIFIFGLSWASGMLLGMVGIGEAKGFVFFLLFFSYPLLRGKLRIFREFVGVVMALLRLIFDQTIYSWGFAVPFIALLLVLFLARSIIFTSARTFSRPMPFSELKEGEIPAEVIFMEKGRYLKAPFYKILEFRKAKKPLRYLFRFPSQGLSSGEIRRIEKARKNFPFSTLLIRSSLPFAAFIFLGALLVIAANILPWGIWP